MNTSTISVSLIYCSISTKSTRWWNVPGWWITQDESDQSSKTTYNVKFFGEFPQNNSPSIFSCICSVLIYIYNEFKTQLKNNKTNVFQWYSTHFFCVFFLAKWFTILLTVVIFIAFVSNYKSSTFVNCMLSTSNQCTKK